MSEESTPNASQRSRPMSEEVETPDLVELWREASQAGERFDLDGVMAFYAPDAVYDMSHVGMGTFEGREAIRGFLADWLGSYEEYERGSEELLDLGNGVAFGLFVQKGRPAGSSRRVEERVASVSEWEDGKVKRITSYSDIDEARAVAERLAEERG
jgi:ketosteroid isomerase-like protein